MKILVDNKIKSEGLTKILKVKNADMIAKYFTPEKELFFIVAAELKEKLKREEILI